MAIDRQEVTEPMNFVWIPAGYTFGAPIGIVGYWEGDTKDGVPLIDFPEGQVRLSSSYIKMYEPTESEIDEVLKDDARWAKRFAEPPEYEDIVHTDAEAEIDYKAEPSELCICGHEKLHHINGEQGCRGVLPCPCSKYRPKAEPPEYEPLCWRCSDNGFLIVAYGESASGTKECPDCKGRNKKRRKEFFEPKAEGDGLEDAAKAMYEASFNTNGRYASDPQAPALMASFARQQIAEQEPRIRREAVADFVRRVEDYADHFGDGTQQGFVRDALEAGKKEMS